jgi:hypothetical protein
VALRAGSRLEDRGGAPRVRLRAQGGQRSLEQLQLAGRIAEGRDGVGRRGQHGDAVGAGQRLGIRNTIPELERAVEQCRRFAISVHALRGRRGAHRSGQRRRRVACSGEVMGHGGRGLRAGASFEALLERTRERQV